ncbi:DUF3159 domain-containing protein [Actinomycetospora lemnae]|uniref:DUF3159 domain-containing protein n=1 Tax=Actinomycetospora lemnae TaxID=3019891 RepID=A0ABT5SUZ4_9PSEU|nr:DUF3159 domain-containing protein [Actinomycetospora sp. DW7H6]MDD7966667.1 DUF3159 domain-containing protein [Actinomycetospora sp. DW7H6]
MTMTEHRHPHAPSEEDPPTAPVTVPPTPTRRTPTVLEQVGGPLGFVSSAVPVIVFVTANAFLPLGVTIAVSLAAGLGLTVFRLLRGERVASALGSLVGVAVAAGLVAWTGSARDFFAIGIWISLAGFVATLATVIARRPVTGLVWNALHGGAHDWRADRAVLRAHDVATVATALVFGARFAVQQWLYVAEATGALGVARIVMGTPLSVVALVITVWAFRRSTQRLVTSGSRAGSPAEP